MRSEKQSKRLYTLEAIMKTIPEINDTELISAWTELHDFMKKTRLIYALDEGLIDDLIGKTIAKYAVFKGYDQEQQASEIRLNM